MSERSATEGDLFIMVQFIKHLYTIIESYSREEQVFTTGAK